MIGNKCGWVAMLVFAGLGLTMLEARDDSASGSEAVVARRDRMSREHMGDLVEGIEARGGGAELVVQCNGAYGYATIQAAIEAAEDGDVVVVLPNDCNAEGRYYENIDFLGKAITVRSSDGPAVTTIDANGSGTVVTCTSGEGPSSVLEGFTITGGTGASARGSTCGGGMYSSNSSPTVVNCIFSWNSAFLGGGLYLKDGSPTLAECRFSWNSALLGGGLHSEDGNPTLTDCAFEHNIASFAGGGLYTLGSPILIGCTFVENVAEHTGGGMYGEWSATLTECSFVRNSAWKGGGMSTRSLLGSAIPKLTKCRFVGNIASSSGGGLVTWGPFTGDGAILTDCVFERNSAATNGGGMHAYGNTRLVHCSFKENAAIDGGGINSRQGDHALHDHTFVENLAPISQGRFLNQHGAAALWASTLGGNPRSRGVELYYSDVGLLARSGTFSENPVRRIEGMMPDSGDSRIQHVWSKSGGGFRGEMGSSTLLNCEFTANAADNHGGAVFIEYSGTATLTGCTLLGNVINGTTGDGGGIHVAPGVDATVTNCIIWGNRRDGEIDEAAQIGGSDSLNVAHTCIQGLDTLSGNGNIGDDPLLVEAGHWDDNGTPEESGDDVWVEGDYHLTEASPCIEAGDPDLVVEPGAADMDDEGRVADGDGDGEAVVDMGADEYHDCNGNEVADYLDIALGTGVDYNGNNILDECEPGLDVRPGGCPNPLNRSSHGYLPVAVVGQAVFDVAQIDVSSVVLERADGVGGAVAPNEGPPGPHSVIEDVATPFEGGGCDCDDWSGDGIDDLVMKFRVEEVVAALELDDLSGGEEIELVVRGLLVSGAAFSTTGDCVVIVP